ncbi:MAG: hypothetical protein PHV34_12000 [Verrucomicrobiae bacterium]|nr:hypothetical protein [Verrucomicrobiae bacterium]
MMTVELIPYLAFLILQEQIPPLASVPWFAGGSVTPHGAMAIRHPKRWWTAGVWFGILLAGNSAEWFIPQNAAAPFQAILLVSAAGLLLDALLLLPTYVTTARETGRRESALPANEISSEKKHDRILLRLSDKTQKMELQGHPLLSSNLAPTPLEDFVLLPSNLWPVFKKIIRNSSAMLWNSSVGGEILAEIRRLQNEVSHHAGEAVSERRYAGELEKKIADHQAQYGFLLEKHQQLHRQLAALRGQTRASRDFMPP